MTPDVAELTDPPLMVNVADVAPAGIVTVEGTETAVELDDSKTTMPPLGAAAENVTVP
jgi:hypothetical protein